MDNLKAIKNTSDYSQLELYARSCVDLICPKSKSNYKQRQELLKNMINVFLQQRFTELTGIVYLPNFS